MAEDHQERTYYVQHPQATPAYISLHVVFIKIALLSVLALQCTQTDSVKFNTNYILHVGICMQVWLVDVGHTVILEHTPAHPYLVPIVFFTSSSLHFL